MSDRDDRRLDAIKRQVARQVERGRGRAATAEIWARHFQERFAPYAGDPCAFAEALVDSDSGEPFRLYPIERAFLREALTRTPAGALPYPELVFGAPKKSGKTTLAAIVLLYVVRVVGGRGAEGYCVANDFDQAAGRVFRAAARILDASPLLRGTATVTQDRLVFLDGASITALAADYAGAAGANPSIVVFDELWAYRTEAAVRLFDELVPVPTRPVSVRLTVSYAGFEGEGDLLGRLYARGLKGTEIAPALYRQDGFLMFWSHVPVAPWQTPAWLAQMRAQLRPNAYARMIENRFVSTEGAFVDADLWARCVNPARRPVLVDKTLPVWVGVDASVKRDATALVAVTFDRARQKVVLVWHRTFHPSPDDPLDFEATVERTLVELRGRFRVQRIDCDPWQLVAVMQRLARLGLPMHEVAQSVPKLTEVGTTLFELVKGGNLETYPDAELERAVTRAVAVETARGWRLGKQHASDQIDLVVALALACAAAVEAQATQWPLDAPAGIMITI